MNTQSTGARIYKMGDFYRCDSCRAARYYKDGMFIPTDILCDTEGETEFYCHKCTNRMMKAPARELSDAEVERALVLIRVVYRRSSGPIRTACLTSDFYFCDDCGSETYCENGTFIAIDTYDEESGETEFHCHKCTNRLMKTSLQNLSVPQTERALAFLRIHQEA